MERTHILLVEDNEGDVMLASEAFESAKLRCDLSVVRDGESAMDFLLRRHQYLDVKVPDLILLDLNLPKKNGYEVLQFLKTNTNLKHIPVIVLSTSSSMDEVNKCYENHANCYITKPMDIENFFNIVSKIENFWLTAVNLPKKNRIENDQRQ
ncbi:MAG: response regulator [Ginsengibacter sp.]